MQKMFYLGLNGQFGCLGLASLRDAPAGASFARSSQIRYHALQGCLLTFQ